AHLVRDAAAEVAPAVLTSVLTTVVSFLPVFGLSSAELRLFAPLAFTKTFAMAGALLLALVILPGSALVVLRRRPGPVSPELPLPRRVLRSVFRAVHLRDWLLLIFAVLLFRLSPVAAGLVFLFGCYRLARPLLRTQLSERL